MSKNAKEIILYGTLIIVGSYFLLLALVKGQGFFVPLTIGILLAMLVAPLANKFEQWGLGKGWSAFVSDLVLIGFTVLLFWLVGMQIKKIQEDWPQIKKELVNKAGQLDKTLDSYSWAAGSKLNLQEKIKNATSSQGGDSLQYSTASNRQNNSNGIGQKEASGEKGSKGSNTSSNLPFQKIWTAVKGLFGFFGSMLLIFIYVFFFLLYRRKFEKSVLQFVPKNKTAKTKEIISESSNIAQEYLVGKAILIIFLAIFYAIGLSIAGIKYAIFISIIAAVLSLIPYIGNLIGASFAVIMALLSGSSSGLTPLIGVGITFFIAQFIESYVLEPFVVGDKVNLNPVMTIVAVIFGDFIWGIPGMVLAIPILGICKVVWDSIPALKPLGYTVGQEGIENSDSAFDKVENWVKNKFGKNETKE